MTDERTAPSIEELEEYNKMVNSNTILLSFEGWIKYIEGFTRGLQTTKMVDANSVMDCIGEVLEYMTQLRGQIMDILNHCENILEKNDELVKENEDLKLLVQQLTTPKLETTNNVFIEVEEEEDGKEV